jgi:hypothetical protein
MLPTLLLLLALTNSRLQRLKLRHDGSLLTSIPGAVDDMLQPMIPHIDLDFAELLGVFCEAYQALGVRCASVRASAEATAASSHASVLSQHSAKFEHSLTF